MLGTVGTGVGYGGAVVNWSIGSPGKFVCSGMGLGFGMRIGAWSDCIIWISVVWAVPRQSMTGCHCSGEGVVSAKVPGLNSVWASKPWSIPVGEGVEEVAILLGFTSKSARDMAGSILVRLRGSAIRPRSEGQGRTDDQIRTANMTFDGSMVSNLLYVADTFRQHD